MLDIPCIIFAGGKSSRMGEDKSLLPFGGFSTLAEFQYIRLSKIFRSVFIVCKESAKFPFVADFIEESSPVYAPSAGFVALFEQLSYQKVFVLSVDTPFVGKNEINKILCADAPDVDAVIAKTDKGIQPMCGIYHRSLAANFTSMLQENNHKLSFLLRNSNTNYIEFKDEKPFINLNHPYEYKEALQLISSS